MKKTLKFSISVVCVIALCFTMVTSATAINESLVTTPSSSESKLSNELITELDKIESNDKIEVYLWVSDINHAKSELDTKKLTGVSKSDMNNLSNSIYETYCDKNNINFASLNNSVNVNSTKWLADTKAIRAEVNEKVDNYIVTKRGIEKALYQQSNSKILSDLEIPEKDIIFQSQYSPMNIVTLTRDEILSIASNSDVESIGLVKNFSLLSENSSNIQDYETVVSSTSWSDEQLMNLHKNSIDATGLSSEYSGENIKMGMIEIAFPQNNYPTLGNADLRNVCNIGFDPTQNLDDMEIPHACTVASILVGDNGMVPDATLYSLATGRGTFLTSNYYAGVESLITFGVNIINQSMGRTIAALTYGLDEQWFDHISKYHNVTFVQLSGNASTETYNIWNPGLAYNVITVGGFDDNQTYSLTDDYMFEASCYNNGNCCFKPDLIGPGCDYIAYFSSNWTSSTFLTSGTSFASPMVAGVAAYLMQANSTLKTNPTAIKAILCASCDRKVLDSDGITQSEQLGGLTEKQGAGVVNANTAVQIALNNKFSTGTISNRPAGSYFEASAVEMSNTPRRSFSLAWEVDAGNISNHTVPTPAIMFNCNFDLRVRTTTSQTIIGASSKTNSSLEVVNISSPANTFFMRAVNNQAISSDKNVRYAFAWCGQ